MNIYAGPVSLGLRWDILLQQLAGRCGTQNMLQRNAFHRTAQFSAPAPGPGSAPLRAGVTRLVSPALGVLSRPARQTQQHRLTRDERIQVAAH
jgi:hypothetical protein